MASFPTFRGVVGLLMALAASLAADPAASRETRAPHAMLQEIEQSAATIRMDLRAARDDGDLLRARCMSGKLSEVHAQQRLAERHAADLRVSRDAQSAKRHRYLLRAAIEYAHELTADARRCGSSRRSSLRVLTRPGARLAAQ